MEWCAIWLCGTSLGIIELTEPMRLDEEDEAAEEAEVVGANIMG